jgi:hypothetical protein
MSLDFKSGIRRLWPLRQNNIIEGIKIKDSYGKDLDKGDVVQIGSDFAVIGGQTIHEKHNNEIPSIIYIMATGRYAGESFFATQNEINSCGSAPQCGATPKMVKVADFEKNPLCQRYLNAIAKVRSMLGIAFLLSKFDRQSLTHQQ